LLPATLQLTMMAAAILPSSRVSLHEVHRMVFPIGDDNTGRILFPAATILLILANIAVFLLQLAQGEPGIERFFMMWSVIPAEYSEGRDLPPLIPLPFWITVFTSMFMHAGWLHLFGNMLYLWIFGDNVEDAMGRPKYVVFYLLCGVIATAAQIATNPDSQIPNVGASGAISGILGAYLVLYPKRRVRVFLLRAIVYMPAVAVIGLWILLQFFNGVGEITRTPTEETGGVAYAAHIGGFLAGVLLVFLFRPRRERALA
jgi:membrane associated rhomboid family serine protease